MPSGTRSYVTVYDYSQEDFEHLEFSCDVSSEEFFEHVVPHRTEWGDVHHIGLEDVEYDPRSAELSFTAETKWFGPVSWLKAASGTEFFEGKLITMAIVTRDETVVDAIAVLSRDTLNERNLVHLESETVGAMYENDEVDELDRLLWQPIEEFNKECRELYLVQEGE